MLKSRKILPLFFLSLFSILMLHQLIPHVHHQHSEVVAHIKDKHHHHEGHGHQHGNQNEDEDKAGFLGLLLGSHVHSAHFSEIQFFRNTQKQEAEVSKVVSIDIAYVLLILPVDEAVITIPFPLENEYPPLRQFLVSNALRGPPTLG